MTDARGPSRTRIRAMPAGLIGRPRRCGRRLSLLRRPRPRAPRSGIEGRPRPGAPAAAAPTGVRPAAGSPPACRTGPGSTPSSSGSSLPPSRGWCSSATPGPCARSPLRRWLVRRVGGILPIPSDGGPRTFRRTSPSAATCSRAGAVFCLFPRPARRRRRDGPRRSPGLAYVALRAGARSCRSSSAAITSCSGRRIAVRVLEPARGTPLACEPASPCSAGAGSRRRAAHRAAACPSSPRRPCRRARRAARAALRRRERGLRRRGCR